MVPAGALVVVVSGANTGAVVVVGSTFGTDGESPAVGPGTGAGAAAWGGRVKLSPSTWVAGAAWGGSSPAARAATAAAPPTATLRAGWAAWRGINGTASRGPRLRAQRRRPIEMSRKARTTSGSKSWPAHSANSRRAASARIGRL